MPQREREKILVVSRDPRLADVRKTVLENAGFAVIPATAENATEEVRKCEHLRLIMLGYSVPPAEKRRVWVAVREHCNVPILELHHNGTPDLMEQDVFAHLARQPDDFLDSVRKLLSPARNGRNSTTPKIQ
ncbi:MAG TPA: hypothetical protein VM912_00490 [Terriglobales bacterium]|nr:hypothetical protein [Terriglobales bacterium]